MLKFALGVILLLVGFAVIAWAIFHGFSALASLYQGALNDALNQPENTEVLASNAMKKAAIIGGIGAIPFLIGSFILKRHVIRIFLASKSPTPK
jgi:uncharacterized membrane protein